MSSIYSNLHYWLVDHPTITQFEWAPPHTFGSTPTFLLLTILTYLTLTLSLYHLRRDLPPIPAAALRLISAAHNLLILLLSLAMAAGATLSTLHQMPHHRWIFCFPANQTPTVGPTFFWAYIFYLSKIVEFIDTLLIILGGTSIRRLSFLHVYHHAAVVIMCYFWLSAPQSLFPVALVTNASVHTLMYAYYLMCAVGRRPRWKRAVTDCQIGQFVFSFVVSGLMWYYHLTGTDSGCSGISGWCFNAFFNASLLALFMDFHSKNYAKGKRIKGHDDAEGDKDKRS